MLGMQSYARSGSFVTPPFWICFVTKHYCEKINFACKELMWPGPPSKVSLWVWGAVQMCDSALEQ